MKESWKKNAPALVAAHGSIRAAAREVGVPYATFRFYAHTPAGEEIEYPNLPDDDLSVDEIIDGAVKEFSRGLASAKARKWFQIKINSNKPIGIVFIGDPHIDNGGTNWPLLREHINLLETTPGLYAIGGNDLTDNWVGRLMRLAADSNMSRKRAWKLAKWLLADSKVKWLCHVLGNHDSWGDGAVIFRSVAGEGVPVEDWQARFEVVFPNASKVRIHMAHDFPGHSQWNHLHGAQKQALFGENADIYACAHKHCWAMHAEEHAHRGFVYHLLRARGYKFLDSYADHHGFGSQRYGASITAVIDPRKTGADRIHCFADIAQAAEFLTWLRQRN